MTAKTTATAGKTAKKPATARKSSKAAKPASSKLTAAQKHTAHVKHEQHLAHVAHLTAIGRAPKVALARAGDHLPLCAFEAIAQSLRLAGQRVDSDEVGHLWTLAGADPLGATVGDALAAAVRFGLAGCRPAWDATTLGTEDLAGVVGAYEPGAEVDVRRADLELAAALGTGAVGVVKLPVLDGPVVVHSLILQIDAPGPHAVLATDRGWWSWGDLHDPWPCSIDQAWAVSWS